MGMRHMITLYSPYTEKTVSIDGRCTRSYFKQQLPVFEAANLKVVKENPVGVTIEPEHTWEESLERTEHIMMDQENKMADKLYELDLHQQLRDIVRYEMLGLKVDWVCT